MKLKSKLKSRKASSYLIHNPPVENLWKSKQLQCKKKLFFFLLSAILIMDMYVKNLILAHFLLILTAFAAIAFLAGCDAVDTLFSSADTYKINAYINGLPLDECSYIYLEDEITPFFEEAVSKDPDITSLIISIKKPAEDESIIMAVYSLENETELYSEARSVKNMDTDLTSFVLPEDLKIGFYTMVFEIMSGDDILQRTEKLFCYMSDAVFLYEGITIHLPGISDNPQLISRGQILLLEAKLNFDSILDPYIVWYNGKLKIAEGFYSKGAGLLLWKAPEQSNFYSLRAEVFPVFDYGDLAGYRKDVSILVSSKSIDINLISENIPELENWYVFEGNLQDLKNPVYSESNNAVWMPFNGTYGLGTGAGNYFSLPKVFIPEEGNTWQLLYRFAPLNNGSVLAINFGTSANTVLDLSINENVLELKLSSPLREVSRNYYLPAGNGSFITMGINFSATRTYVSAKINILGETAEQGELAAVPIWLEANIGNEFQILLGQKSGEVYTADLPDISLSDEPEEEEQEEFDEPDEAEEPEKQDKEGYFVKPSASYFTAVWDEFALYKNPPMEVITRDILSISAEEKDNSE